MTKKLAIYSRLICVLITAQIANFSIAQTSLELIAPLNIPLILSGNFGEFRGSHFHTGIDLKTQGKEGFPVLAAADGKVKRVKVSPWGYGNALYLEHSDGSQTVYAHLQKFAPEIEAWLLKKQLSTLKPLAGQSIRPKIQPLAALTRTHSIPKWQLQRFHYQQRHQGCGSPLQT